jgi:hypothetical protein
MTSSQADGLTTSGSGSTNVKIANNTSTVTVTADDNDDGDETFTVTYTLNGTQATSSGIAAGIVVTDAGATATAIAAILNAITDVSSTATAAVVTAAATDKAHTFSIDSVTVGGTVNGLAGAVAQSGSVGNNVNLTNVATKTSLILDGAASLAGSFNTGIVTTVVQSEVSLTVTQDDADNGDETLVVTYTLDGTTANVSISAGTNVNVQNNVATDVAALLNAVVGITASSSANVITAAATNSGLPFTIDSIVIGGTTNGLAVASAGKTLDITGASNLPTSFVVSQNSIVDMNASQANGLTATGSGTVKINTEAAGAGNDFTLNNNNNLDIDAIAATVIFDDNSNASTSAIIVKTGATLTLTAAQASGKTMTDAGAVVITNLGGDTDADFEAIAVTGGVTVSTNNSDSITFTGKLPNTNTTFDVSGSGTTAAIDMSGASLAAGYNKASSTLTLNAGMTATLSSLNADDLTVAGAGTTKINLANNTSTLTVTADGNDDGNETFTVTYTLNGTQATSSSIALGIVVTDASATATAIAAILNAVAGVSSTATAAVVTAAATDKANTFTIDSVTVGGTVGGGTTLAGAIAQKGSLTNDLNLTNVGTNTTLALATDTTFSGTFKAEAVTVTGAKELDITTAATTTVPSSITVSNASGSLVALAAQVNGLTVVNAGETRVILNANGQLTATSDLSDITSNTLTFAESDATSTAITTFSVLTGATLTVKAEHIGTSTVSGAGSVVVSDAVAATQYNFSNLSANSVIVQYAGGSYNTNTNLGTSAKVENTAGTLIMTAADASGVDLLGAGVFNISGVANAQVLNITGTGNNVIDPGAGGDTINITSTGGTQTVNIGAAASSFDINTINATGVGATYVINSAVANQVNAAGSTQALTINGSTGSDNITGGKGADIIVAGDGDDNIFLVEDGADQLHFASTGAGNGTDSILNFAATGAGADKFVFTSFDIDGNSGATNAAGGDLTAVLTADAATTVSGKIALLVEIAGNQDISTAAGLETALASGGEYASIDMTANTKAVFVTAATNGANQTMNVFMATSNGSGVIDVDKVATATGLDIDDLSAANFII